MTTQEKHLRSQDYYKNLNYAVIPLNTENNLRAITDKPWEVLPTCHLFEIMHVQWSEISWRDSYGSGSFNVNHVCVVLK